MNLSELYRQKLTTAERAVDAIRSGDRVYVHAGCATPAVLTEALLERAGALHDVEIIHLLTFGKADYTLPQYDGHFRHNGLFLGANVREAVAAGRADYTPIMLSEIEQEFCSGRLPLDVVLIQLSPPDDYGYMSLGVGVECTLNAARCARRVIAEVNQRMPRTMGDTFLHVSKVSAIVETDRPLLELKPEPFTDLERQIGEHVASLIPDGATLQTGIGGIPDAVLALLGDKRDLGIHSEMCSDGVIPLIESGVITGDRKTLHRGKIVVGFVLGTEKLFRFIDENPIFELHPTMYTNDPFVIGQNERMISINSAIQVDVTAKCAPIRSARVRTAASEASSISFGAPHGRWAANRSSHCRQRPRGARCRGSCPCSIRARGSSPRAPTCTMW